MSLNLLSLDKFKPWLDARVCNLTVDCDVNLPDGSINVDSLESTGNVGFLHDDGSSISVKDIEIGDIQEIGVGANDGDVLTYSGGVVSFEVGSGGVNIYNSDGVLTSDRTVTFNSNDLILDNRGNIIIDDPLIQNNSEDHLLVRNNVSGVVEYRDSNSIIIPASNLSSTGVTGVLFDNGANIVQTNHPILGNLTANSFTFDSMPNIDNTETSLLVHDNVTGEIEIRQVSSLPFTSDTSIYNTNASLTGDRIVNCNSNDITFSNNDNFTVGEFAASSTYFTIADNNLFATGYPGIDLSHRDSSNDRSYFQVLGSASGSKSILGHDTISPFFHQSLVECAEKQIGLTCTEPGGNSELINIEADLANPLGSTGGTTIYSNALILSRSLNKNNSNSTLLVRNTSNGVVEERDVSSLGGSSVGFSQQTTTFAIASTQKMIFDVTTPYTYNDGNYNNITGDYTVVEDGHYRINTTVTLARAGLSSSTCRVRILVNGTDVIIITEVVPVGTSSIRAGASVELTIGDIITIEVDRSGAVTSQGGAESILSIHKL